MEDLPVSLQSLSHVDVISHVSHMDDLFGRMQAFDLLTLISSDRHCTLTQSPFLNSDTQTLTEGFGVWGLGFGVWGLGDRKSVV